MPAALARPGLTAGGAHPDPHHSHGTFASAAAHRRAARRMSRVCSAPAAAPGRQPLRYWQIHFVRPIEAAAATLRMKACQSRIRKPADVEPAITSAFLSELSPVLRSPGVLSFER
jgi:hypothetical protein